MAVAPLADFLYNSKAQSQEAKHPGQRQRSQGARSRGQTSRPRRSARFPARPPRVFCGSGGGARLSSHYQAGRSTGRRRARVHACVAFARWAEPITPRATCGGARECVSSCSRPRRAQSLSAVRLARLDRRHLAAGAVSRYTFISLCKAPFRLENSRVLCRDVDEGSVPVFRPGSASSVSSAAREECRRRGQNQNGGDIGEWEWRCRLGRTRGGGGDDDDDDATAPGLSLAMRRELSEEARRLLLAAADDHR